MDGRLRRESGRQNREPNEPRAGVSRPEMGERALETCGFRGVYARDLFVAQTCHKPVTASEGHEGHEGHVSQGSLWLEVEPIRRPAGAPLREKHPARGEW